MKLRVLLTSILLTLSLSAFAFKSTLLPARTAMTASGSGHFINEEGYIATAAHVINPYRSAFGTFYPTHIKILYKGELRPIQIVATDQKNDIAILKVNVDSPTPYLNFSTEVLKKDSNIYVSGYPDVYQYGLFLHTTVGKFTMSWENMLIMNTPACHGNSGGAALDDRGNVLGTLDIGIGENIKECYKESGAVEFKYTKALADKHHIKTYSAGLDKSTLNLRTMYFKVKSLVEEEKVVFIITEFKS